MSTTKRKVTLAELATLAGSTVGTSAPHEVSQRRIQAFADATEDHQWIHVDQARASTGPFGGTIAHGCLTVPLGSALLWEVLEVTDSVQVINYGLDKHPVAIARAQWRAGGDDGRCRTLHRRPRPPSGLDVPGPRCVETGLSGLSNVRSLRRAGKRSGPGRHCRPGRAPGRYIPA